MAPSSAHRPEESEHASLEGGAIRLTDEGKTAIGLQLERVAVRPVPRRIQTTGKLEAIPTKEYIQHSPISGRVAHVFVRLGDQVASGQTLVSISSPELQELGAQIVSEKTQIEAEISARKAELDGEISQAQTQKDLAEINFNRQSRLYQEKIASQKAMQQAKAELELSANKLKVAQQKGQVVLNALRTKLSVNLNALKQRLRQYGLSDQDVDRMLAQRKSMTDVPVRTARSGVITELSVTPGQSLDPSVPLAKVSDLSTLWAAANVYESDMSQVRLGEPIAVKVAAFPEELFSGKVSFISSSVDPVTRVLPVKVAVTNKESKLRPGMFAELSVQTANPVQVIALPKDAVLSDKGHYLVYVEENGAFVPTPVEVGNSYGDKIEIHSGLAAGQMVVVRGAFQLDAQRLKSIGEMSLFTHPTEEGHEEHEHVAGDKGSGPTPQLLIMAAIAFVLGCAITALWQRNKNQNFDNKTRQEAGLRKKGN